MKNNLKILSLFILTATLAACAPSQSSSSSNSSSSQTSISAPSKEDDNSSSSTSNDETNPDVAPNNGDKLNEQNLANNPQDGTILHAWSWSLKEIKNSMKDIAKAGFSSVQTSPMQPQKDFWNGDSIKAWWKVYQPFGLSVATSNNAIGTKDDLKQLCKEADKYGVKVIVDVVANHLAGGNENSFNSKIKDFEPEIYNNNLCHKGIGYNSDSDPKKVVQGNIGGFPDLKTEDPIVQNAVLDLLKEYVDCGVDGFRFDAAKHIETPEDPEEIKSDFWKVTLNGVKEYAISKGMNAPFAYGEILHTVGKNRSYLDYTKRMSVTDSDASEKILNAVKNKKADSLSEFDVFTEEVTAKDAVLWGESHDTFANDKGTTKNVNSKLVNKAYAITASKTLSSSLYFIRPSNDMKLGTKSSNLDWQSEAIKQVNKFHNLFIGSKEDMSFSSGDLFVNVQQRQTQSGAVLVNLGNKTEYSVNVNKTLKDGNYIDHVNNKQVSVKDGVISGTFDESGIAVIYNDADIVIPTSNKPKISVSDEGDKSYKESVEIEIKVENAEQSTYQIDDNEAVSFKDSVKVKIGENVKNGSVSLKINAENKFGSTKKTFTYNFVSEDVLHPVVQDLDANIINNKKLAVWVWDDNNKATSRFIEGTLDGTTFSFEVNESDTHFILVTFENNAEIDWKNKIKQTEDIKLGKTIYTKQDIRWK